MANLLAIRKRIKSVKNTRKITKAMQLVASSKMRQFQKKAVNARKYTYNLLEILQHNLNDGQKNILSQEREAGKILFVLYTSDKGLCGSLNSKMLKGLFASELWLNTPKEERVLFTIGKKSHDYAAYNHIKVHKSYKSLSEDMKPIDALKIVDEILKCWTSEDIKEVRMVSPHYKSALVFYPVMKKYLPFSQEMIDENLHTEDLAEGKDLKEYYTEADTNKESHMIYEPSKEEFKEALMQQIIQTLFTQSFFELKAAEYSSRMIAMQNATDSADEMVDKFTLSLNKARQAIITQEIAEIVAGSMA